MSRINVVTEPTGKVEELLQAVEAALGVTPNMMKTMAQSPVLLEAYLGFNGTLSRVLDPRLREQIALVTAEENGCGYCAAAHTALGKLAGLTDEETKSARSATDRDPKTETALKFVQRVIRTRGKVSDDDLRAVRNAGFTDGNIAEIIGHISLNILTNYFNEVAKTDVDFPAVDVPLKKTVSA